MEEEPDHIMNEELDPSVLGTIDHWKKEYAESIERFEEFGDVGEIWFGKDCMKRIVNWMITSDEVSKEDAIIDLGCGNAVLLFSLAKVGFTNLTGVDYSEEAIKLSELIKQKENFDSVHLKVQDLLSSDIPSEIYNTALDKGTYDAISLNPEDPSRKRKVYLKNVHTMLKTDGLFILTSCNWTEKELLEHLKSYFKLLESISAPKFQFGGKTGNTVTTLILKKIDEGS